MAILDQNFDFKKIRTRNQFFLEISEVLSIPTDEDDSKYVSDSSDDDDHITAEQRKLNKTNSVARREL